MQFGRHCPCVSHAYVVRPIHPCREVCRSAGLVQHEVRALASHELANRAVSVIEARAPPTCLEPLSTYGSTTSGEQQWDPVWSRVLALLEGQRTVQGGMAAGAGDHYLGRLASDVGKKPTCLCVVFITTRIDGKTEWRVHS